MQNKFEHFLAQHIKNHGSIDLGSFISEALAHHEYGFYVSHDPFGPSGDFTTAPEVSQMFGEVVGAWVIDLWMQMGEPRILNLVECGPGRGTLMADIMRVGKVSENFVGSVRIRFIETSAVLREKQSKALQGYDLQWYKALSDVDDDEPCIILGNEFLDALPIEQLKRNDGSWKQRTVSLGEMKQDFEFDWRIADRNLLNLLPQKTISNQIYEVAPARNRFIFECNELLNKSGGAALFIDYGYTKSHYGDTLQAIKKHEYVDILSDISQCDITSHIDFDALSRYARKLGLYVETLLTQREFLRFLGIEQRAEVLKNTALEKLGSSETEMHIKNIESALSRLIGKNQMGDLFKVMCFHHGYKLYPVGF